MNVGKRPYRRGLGLGLGLNLGGGGGAAPAFSPSTPIGGSISGVMWLKPGALQTTGSGKITAWGDSFGLGHGMTSSSSGVIFNSASIGTNSIPTVGGSSNADAMVGSNIATMMSGAVSADLFMVMTGLGGATGNPLTLGWGAAAANDYFRFSDGNVYDDFCSSVRSTGFAAGSDGPIVYHALSDAAAWSADVNGVSKFTRGTNTFAAFSASLGLWGRTGALWLGTIGEVIVYKSSASGGIGSTNVGKVITYLRTEFGF